MAGTGFELPPFGMGGSALDHCATTAPDVLYLHTKKKSLKVFFISLTDCAT
ncbi:hypothetical protein JGG40_23675 [Salmonella enterica subsp. enterica serovar Derby]|nr:hypothetical protein [Salmonella enterica subsp. enterica serovar Derby]